MDNIASDTAAALRAGQASMQDATQAGLARASAGLAATQSQMKDQMGQAVRKAEDVASFGQGNLEAVLKSGQIWAAGMQDLSKQFAATAQAQMDETMNTFRTLSGLRSLKDVMDLQANFARATMEKAMAESSRMTDAGLKLAEETMAPLTARVGVAVETFSKAA